MKAAKKRGLVKITPAKGEPDLIAILAYVKKTGEIPPGSKFVPSSTNFSYSLTNGRNNNGDGEEQYTEARP